MTKKKALKENELVHSIVDGLKEVKADEVVVMDLRKVPNAITDYFVIAQAGSTKHAEALARSVEKFTETQLDESPGHVEGRENAGWILMDYFDVVVHIFLAEERRFYALEELWADAPVLELA
jgi:ribosome-associated protein